MVKLEIRSPRSVGEPSSLRWFVGMMMASAFSMAYFVAPLYLISATILLVLRFPSFYAALLYATPILISAIVKPIPSPWLVKRLTPMFDYFDFEEIHEISPVNVWEEIINGKAYLGVYQPHGALSYGGILAAVNSPPVFQCTVKTAVAEALLYTPILKHVIGVFNLVSASKSSMQKTLRMGGIDGTLVLYVGGMAELFLTSEEEEQLYLMKRKGFIKLALQEGVDVVPSYMFGNTTVLSVLKTGLLADISRKLQVSLTYIWGRWGLPIPRPCKILYVTGQPLGMPKISNPTHEDIDKWHAKYCEEVTRIFNTYKERVPEYKHKRLRIV